MEQKNLLIMGASGMIGGAFKRLAVLNNFKNIFTPSRRELDLSNRPAILDYILEKKIDWLMMAAGKVGGISANIINPVSFLDDNAQINLNTMWAAHRANVEKVIVFGSSCMYPVDAKQPIQETSLLSGRVEQTSYAYAAAKILTVQAVRAYNSQFPAGTKFIAVVPNSTYGPGDNFNVLTGHVLSALISKIHNAKIEDARTVELWGTGNPLREFIFCDDVAAACMFLFKKDFVCDEYPINISNNSEISISQLACLIAGVIGFKGEIKFDQSKPDGAYRKSLDVTKLTALGWEAKVSLKQGLKETYKWYCKKQMLEQQHTKH